jgi:sugar phosphate isomerase/epimerase
VTKFVLSCTTCATRQPETELDEISECLIHAPKAGYKAWGLAGPLFQTPGLMQWANYDLLNRRAAAVGLTRCTEVYARSFPTTSIDEAVSAAQDRLLVFEAAEKLGSPLVVMTGRERTATGMEPTIAGIKALLPLIEDKPVRLALEPHYGSQIQFLEDYDAIFAEVDSPQVGITLDSGHFHAAGVDWHRLIQRYANRIYNFQVKDHIGTQSVPIGAGEVDLRGYIEALDSIGYEGALALELEVEDPENLPRYVAEAYVYLRELVLDVTGELPD